jgi:hypothetical protein
MKAFQLTLVPRIDVTTIFKGSSIADIRTQDFEYYGCNDTYYDVALTSHASPKCQELINMAATLVYNGATRKLPKTID